MTKHTDKYYGHESGFKKLQSEELYFMQQDREYVEEQKKEHEKEEAKKALEERKRLHFMKCPKCGADMHVVYTKRLAVDQCTECHGIWLDMEELEAIRDKGPVLLNAMLKNFYERLDVRKSVKKKG